MTKKRKIEILEHMKGMFKAKVFAGGLCRLIHIMNNPYRNLLSDKEFKEMKKFIQDHKPRRITHDGNREYYWKEYARTPRIRWINKRVKELKNG